MTKEERDQKFMAVAAKHMTAMMREAQEVDPDKKACVDLLFLTATTCVGSLLYNAQAAHPAMIVKTCLALADAVHSAMQNDEYDIIEVEPSVKQK